MIFSFLEGAATVLRDDLAVFGNVADSGGLESLSASVGKPISGHVDEAITTGSTGACSVVVEPEDAGPYTVFCRFLPLADHVLIIAARSETDADRASLDEFVPFADSRYSAARKTIESQSGAFADGVPPDSSLVYDFMRINSELVNARRELNRKNADLEKAIGEIKRLSGLLPICSYCKKIRDDRGYWSQVEEYVSEHSDADFSHGICPDCMTKFYPDFKDDDDDETPQEGGNSD